MWKEVSDILPDRKLVECSLRSEATSWNSLGGLKISRTQDGLKIGQKVQKKASSPVIKFGSSRDYVCLIWR